MHPRPGGRKKRQADDINEDSQAGLIVKKPKQAAKFHSVVDDSQSRPARTGAGSGGRIAKLERIGAALQLTQKRNLPRTTLADDVEPNPLAPASLERNRVCTAHFRSDFRLLITL